MNQDPQVVAQEEDTPGRVRFDSASLDSSCTGNEFTVSSSNDADEVWEEYSNFYEDLKKEKKERKAITPEMEEMILNSNSFNSLEEVVSDDFEMELKDQQHTSPGRILRRKRYPRRNSAGKEDNVDNKGSEMRTRLFNACINTSSAVEKKKTTDDKKVTPTSKKADEHEKTIVFENNEFRLECKSDHDDRSTSSSSSGFFGYFQKKKLTMRRSSGRLA